MVFDTVVSFDIKSSCTKNMIGYTKLVHDPEQLANIPENNKIISVRPFKLFYSHHFLDGGSLGSWVWVFKKDHQTNPCFAYSEQ